MLAKVATAAGLAVCLSQPVQAATLVFSDDFSSGAASAAFGGAGAVVDAQGYKGEGGFADNFLRNDASGNPAAATTLSLGGLAAHTTVTLAVDIAFIDSWDGTTPPFGPDFFVATLDGAEVFVGNPGAGVVSGVPGVGFVETVPSQNLGFNSGWPDRGFSLILTAPHAASTAAFTFFARGAGWQGGDDESWALDNVRVSTDAVAGVVPLPAALPLIASAFGALFALRRRRG